MKTGRPGCLFRWKIEFSFIIVNEYGGEGDRPHRKHLLVHPPCEKMKEKKMSNCLRMKSTCDGKRDENSPLPHLPLLPLLVFPHLIPLFLLLLHLILPPEKWPFHCREGKRMGVRRGKRGGKSKRNRLDKSNNMSLIGSRSHIWVDQLSFLIHSISYALLLHNSFSSFNLLITKSTMEIISFFFSSISKTRTIRWKS